MTTPSSSLRVCARSFSNRALRHRKRLARRRGLKANASTPSKLKMDQMQAHLDNAQEALHARAQDQRAREVQGGFDQADQEYQVRTAKAEITARLLSRSPGKKRMDKLKAQRTPQHRTGLTRSPSRVVNRAPPEALPEECRQEHQGHRQRYASSLHEYAAAAPRQNAAVAERVCREGRPRPPPDCDLSSIGGQAHAHCVHTMHTMHTFQKWQNHLK